MPRRDIHPLGGLAWDLLSALRHNRIVLKANRIVLKAA